MKYVSILFLLLVSVVFVPVSSVSAQDSLGSVLNGLKQTCQSYLDSGDFEKAEEALVREYAKATTDRKKEALVKAYGEILKLKEFSEAWTTEPTVEQKKIMDNAYDRFMEYFKGVEYTPKKKNLVTTTEKTETGFVTSFHFE